MGRREVRGRGRVTAALWSAIAGCMVLGIWAGRKTRRALVVLIVLAGAAICGRLF